MGSRLEVVIIFSSFNISHSSFDHSYPGGIATLTSVFMDSLATIVSWMTDGLNIAMT